MRSRMLSLPGVVLCLASSLGACSTTYTPSVAEIAVEELNNLAQQDSTLLLIDVRAPSEYEAVHAVPVKRLIVHTEILDSASNLPPDRDTPIYLICRSGRRSGIAGEALVGLGYRNVFNVAGGTNAWVAAGLPAESGRGILPPAAP